MDLDQHLQHLLWLMEEHPEAWKQHCWHRAKELAKEPEFASLPRLLALAVASQPAPAIASNSKPTEPLSLIHI